MAFGDNLAAGVPAPTSPLQSMAGAMSLREMMQRHALGIEELKAHQLANQQAQLAADRDNAYRTNLANMMNGPQAAPPQQAAPPAQDTPAPPAWQPSNGGPNTSSVVSNAYTPPAQPSGLTPALATEGATLMKKPVAVPGTDFAGIAKVAFASGKPEEGLAALKAGAEHNAKVAEAYKNGAEGDKFNADIAKMHIEQLGQASQALLKVDDTQAAALWPQVRTQLVASGHTPADIPAQYPGRAWVQQTASQAMAVDKQLDAHIAAAAEDRKQQLFPYELAMSKSDATTKDITAGQYKDLGMTKDQFEQLSATKQRDAVNAKLGAQRVGIAGAELNISRERQADNHRLMQGVTDEGTLDTMTRAFESGVPMSQIVRARGNAADATVKQIFARAAQNAAAIGKPFDLATALSNYKAESASNVDMTKTYNSIAALHGIVGKNLDYAIDTFSKLPDTNSKLLNMPIRLVTDKMLGSGQQAEAMAALMSASREAARLTNNFGAKGELTDSARHAMDKLHDPNMTMSEFIGAAKAIKTDANNVMGGYQKGRDDVRQNIGGNTPKPAAGARPSLDSFFK